MDEYFDLSVPTGGSGLFIALHQKGVLKKVVPLWAKFARLQGELGQTRAQLSACNDSTWLLSLAKICQRKGRNFEQELRGKVAEFECSRACFEQELADVRLQLASIHPSLVLEASKILNNGRSVKPEEILRRKKYSNHVLQRQNIIGRYPDLSAFELCKKLEIEDVPLPEQWQDEFGPCAWIAAYKNPKYRKRIDTMFSRDKTDLRLHQLGGAAL